MLTFLLLFFFLYRIYNSEVFLIKLSRNLTAVILNILAFLLDSLSLEWEFTLLFLFFFIFNLYSGISLSIVILQCWMLMNLLFAKLVKLYQVFLHLLCLCHFIFLLLVLLMNQFLLFCFHEFPDLIFLHYDYLAYWRPLSTASSLNYILLSGWFNSKFLYTLLSISMLLLNNQLVFKVHLFFNSF